MHKKILILGHHYASPFLDVCNQYVKVFDPSDEVTVAYLNGVPDETVKKRTLSKKVIFLNFSKKSIRGLKVSAIHALFKLCRKEKFDVVICHRFKPVYIMLWVSLFFPVPSLYFVMHALKTMKSFKRQLLIALLDRKNMFYAGVSHAVRDDMQKSLWGVPKNRIITLYNMIDFELFEPQLYDRQTARRLLGLADDDFVFGNLAKLTPNKDHDSLIKAFAEIKPASRKAKLVIMGSGELADSLNQQVEQIQLKNEIIFTGFVNNAFQYMKAFDCFILPSIQEAFGRVLLEAMIAKLPIIASHTHGIPEVAGPIGTLVLPRDIKGFARAMQHMYQLSSVERERLGEKAYQHALTQFSIPVFKRQFAKL